MDLTPYVAELRDSLTAAASLGDENTQRSTAALAAALEPAARLALLHALSDMASDVTRQLAGGSSDAITVDVRLEGRDVRVVTSRSGAGTRAPEEQPETDDATDDEQRQRTFTDATGDLTRTTVRMFNELKAQAEKAASEQGVSLNSFISRAVSDQIRGEKARRSGRSGERRGRRDWDTTISGYVQG